MIYSFSRAHRRFVICCGCCRWDTGGGGWWREILPRARTMTTKLRSMSHLYCGGWWCWLLLLLYSEFRWIYSVALPDDAAASAAAAGGYWMLVLVVVVPSLCHIYSSSPSSPSYSASPSSIHPWQCLSAHFE